jgi:hypothetical protein
MTLFVPVLWWWQDDPSQCPYPDPENYVAQGTVKAKSRACFSLVFDEFDLEVTGLKKSFYETWCFPMLTAGNYGRLSAIRTGCFISCSSHSFLATICDIAARK